MNIRSTSNRIALFLLAGFIFNSCGEPNPTNPQRGDGHSLDEVLGKKSTGPCMDWNYNAANNDITFTPSANCNASLGKLKLGFKEHMIVERAKDPNPASDTDNPFVEFGNDGMFNYQLRVNGERYSGEIEGYYRSTNKKIMELEMQKGWRQGKFTIWSSSGRAHSENYSEEASNTLKIDEMSVRKPIIYIYPEETQEVNLQIEVANGHLTTTYPKYPEQEGWNVKALPDGTLFDTKTGMEYYALYWEAQSTYKYDLSTGFVVRGEQTADFLDEKLETLGLNRREANEFINYWLPPLESNRYNLIHFSTTEYLEQAQLEISPKPESLIRVFMVYQPLDGPIEIEPQKLETPKRKGFTVVEWGGAEQTKEDIMVK